MRLREGIIMQDKLWRMKRVSKTRSFLRSCASLALLIASPPTITRAQAQKPLLLRDHSISKTQIAFSYAGNLWIANRDGSNVRRLPNAGHERKPIFSPDGCQIACG